MPTACFLLDHFWGERAGGAEWQTFVLCRALREAGWDVHYIAESLTGKSGQTTGKEGIIVHWLPPLQWRSRVHPAQRRFRDSVFSILDEIKPDIIYTRGNNAFTGIGVTHRYRATRMTKVAWGAAADWEISWDFYRQRLAYYQKSWWRKSLLWLDACFKDGDHGNEIHEADTVIVQTSAQQQLVRERFHKEAVVLSSSHEVPSNLPAKRTPMTVVFVAHIGRRKRVDLFVDLARRCADMDARFQVVGDFADSVHEKEIRTRAKELSKIEFLGQQPTEETNRLIAESSLLVSTTDAGREGYPNVFVQAWLRRTPVVSLAFDPDSVISEHEFLGCYARSMDTLINEVRRLLVNPSRLGVMGRSAREWAIRRHSYEANRGQIVRIFEKLAKCNEL